VNEITRQRLANGKRRIGYRLRDIHGSAQDRAMLAASNIDYEVAQRSHGLGGGGIGAMHLLAWSPWQEVLLRAVQALRCPMRC
jgi:hypothetical protein